MQSFFSLIAIVVWLLASCSSSNSIQEKTKFTHLDSLTDRYLVLQDSFVQSWHRVLKNETDKSKLLEELVSHLKSNQEADQQQIGLFQSRLEQLERIRFTQKTLGNPYVVEEYDNACNTLVMDVFKFSETNEDFASTNEFQSALRWMKNIQDMTNTNRYTYDSTARFFNNFIKTNYSALKELERNGQLDKKPLFWATSDDH